MRQKTDVIFHEKTLKNLMQDANGNIKKSVMISGQMCKDIYNEMLRRQKNIMHLERMLIGETPAFTTSKEKHNWYNVESLLRRFEAAGGGIVNSVVLDGADCDAIYTDLDKRRRLLSALEDALNFEHSIDEELLAVA